MLVCTSSKRGLAHRHPRCSDSIGTDIVRLKRVGVLNASFMLAVIVALAMLANALPDRPILQLAVLTPVAYTIAILGDVATAIILLSTWHPHSGRASFVLGLAFAACAAVLLVAFLVLPMLPNDPPIISAHKQSGVWLYTFWHLVAAAGALSISFCGASTMPSRQRGASRSLR
jgi:hypothetical protein